MSKKNYIKLIFYTLLLVSMSIAAFQIVKINSILAQPQPDKVNTAYNYWQTKMGYFNIIAFAVLLVLAFIDFYKQQQKNLIIIANIFYITFTLFIYVSVNRNYYQLISTDYQHQNGYWLTLFMGIFYILGGIIISAIGFITIRNQNKRKISTRE